MLMYQNYLFKALFAGIIFIVLTPAYGQESIADAELEAPLTASPDDTDIAINTEIEPVERNNQNPVSKRIPKPPSGPVVGFAPEIAIENYRSYIAEKKDHKENDRLYRFAYQQQSKGLRASAENTLLDILTTQPDHQRANISLARIQIADQRYQQAIIQLQGLCQRTECHWLAWYWKSMAELLSRDYPSASKSLQKALVLQPEEAALWLLSAQVEQERGDHQSALQLLSIAHQYQPENASIILNIAISNEAIGNQQAALEMYNQYLQLAGRDHSLTTLNQIVLQRIGQMNIANH